MTQTEITNEAEHAVAMVRINELWDRTDQEALDEMEVLTREVDAYERKMWPLDQFRGEK